MSPCFIKAENNIIDGNAISSVKLYPIIEERHTCVELEYGNKRYLTLSYQSADEAMKQMDSIFQQLATCNQQASKRKSTHVDVHVTKPVYKRY